MGGNDRKSTKTPNVVLSPMTRIATAISPPLRERKTHQSWGRGNQWHWIVQDPRGPSRLFAARQTPPTEATLRDSSWREYQQYERVMNVTQQAQQISVRKYFVLLFLCEIEIWLGRRMKRIYYNVTFSAVVFNKVDGAWHGWYASLWNVETSLTFILQGY